MHTGKLSPGSEEDQNILICVKQVTPGVRQGPLRGMGRCRCHSPKQSTPPGIRLPIPRSPAFPAGVRAGAGGVVGRDGRGGPTWPDSLLEGDGFEPLVPREGIGPFETILIDLRPLHLRGKQLTSPWSLPTVCSAKEPNSVGQFQPRRGNDRGGELCVAR